MNRILWPAAFCFSAAFATVFAFAWPDIRANVVLALTVSLWVVIGVLTACLCALCVGFTVYRVRAARADIRIAESAASFAAEVSSPVQPMRSERSAGLWMRAYLDFGWLCFSKGTMAFAQVRDYIVADNLYMTWAHMVGEMKKANFAAVVKAYGAGGRTYKETRFVGSYRNYFRQLMHGQVELSPHPKYPAPVIRAERAVLETTKTTEEGETTETR